MQGCRWPLMYSTPQRSSQGGYGAQCILGEACERERRPVFHTDASSPTAICIPLEVTHLSVEDESKTSRQITFTNIIVFVMAERLRHMLPRCKMGCSCFMQGTFDGVSIKMKKDASVYISEHGLFDVCISSGPKSPLCISTESGTTK